MNFEIHLVQPFSRVLIRLPLPPIYHIDEYNKFYDCQHLCRRKMKKVILTSDPIASPEKCVVMAIHGERRSLAFCKLGDKKWAFLENNFRAYYDIIFYRRQFVGTTSEEPVVVAWELGEVPKVNLFPEVPLADQHNMTYVVESEGDLLYVVRSRVLCHRFDVYRYLPDTDDVDYLEEFVTNRFNVYKLDDKSSTWVEMKSLGDKVLFLGQGDSTSFWYSEVPGCERNSIYFTDDEDYRGKNYGNFDMGMYNMEDGTVEPYYPSDVCHPLYSPPTWFDLPFTRDVFARSIYMMQEK